MRFGVTGYTKAMPFLRFHLGREESEYLISLQTTKLAQADKDKLRLFLADIGERNVLGRTTAILAGKVMFLSYGQPVLVVGYPNTIRNTHQTH